jgi:hypothetical protein
VEYKDLEDIENKKIDNENKKFNARVASKVATLLFAKRH